MFGRYSTAIIEGAGRIKQIYKIGVMDKGKL
jgi:hypothetical protein